MVSFGPKARAAFRRSSFARTRSPSCAIAMPRSASAGASSRSATRFKAPSGSPAASARAAAVISESTGIPPHLSLPPRPPQALNLSHDRQPKSHFEKGETDDDDTHDRDARPVAEGADHAARGGGGPDAAQPRAGAAEAGAAVGPGGKGLPVRDRGGERPASGPVPGALPAPRVPLHVRTRLHRGMPVLLHDRGRVRRVRRAPGQPRR